MGISNSKLQVDNPLLLCRKRRYYVKQALDGRCSLASAHIAYIQALKNTGMALSKLAEPEDPVDLSLRTSTSTTLGTTEPHADKSISQSSNFSSPFPSQHVDTIRSFSHTPSPVSSDRFDVNYTESGGNYPITVEQSPPDVSVAVASRPTVETSPKSSSHSDKSPHFDDWRPFPITPHWDYFDLFHPIDAQSSLQDGGEMNHVSESVDHSPDLEKEGDKSSKNGKPEYFDSEDEFDQPSSEALVRIFEKQNEKLGEFEETRNYIPKSTPSVIPVCTSANDNVVAKDFLSSIKEIEEFFLKASESSKEVLRMLEARKIKSLSLLCKGQVAGSKGSTFFCPFRLCRRDDTSGNGEPISNEVKHLAWNQSVPSLSSSSYIPLGTDSIDDVGDMDDSLFSGVCMNSGSHALTLDRLYAWERKLYDEVKTGGIVRKEYDIKCKLLRDLDSKSEHLNTRGGKSNKIDKTRVNVKDLHTRLMVSIRRIDSISKIIEELRDRELQPQLEELMGGLTTMWETMLQCHKHQHDIISKMKDSSGFSESNRQDVIAAPAMVLQFELNSLYSSFMNLNSSHRSYLLSINQWLLKCVYTVGQKLPSSERQDTPQFSPRRAIAPPIYVTLQDWLQGLQKLPAKEVSNAIKDMSAETANLIPCQENKKNHHHGKPLKPSSFSSSQKIDGSVESTHIKLRNEVPANANLLHRLEALLGCLKMFSESSVSMYVDLGKNITNARKHYGNPTGQA